MKNLPLNGFSTIINSLTYYDIKSGNGLGSRVTKEYMVLKNHLLFIIQIKVLIIILQKKI